MLYQHYYLTQPNYKILQTQLENLSEWEKAKNIYNIQLKYTGEEFLSKEEVIRNVKITNFTNSGRWKRCFLN